MGYLGDKLFLHVGCANRYYDGFINSDKVRGWKGKKYKLDMVMDIGLPWPYPDETIDGIVGMHVFQQLHWRELVIAFRESFRVLKHGGVLRIGGPTVEISDKSLDYLLGWNNVNLFSIGLLRSVLVDRIGFRYFRQRGYQKSWIPELAKLDNRLNRGSVYVEVAK